MSNPDFVRITRIDRTPEINLGDYPEIKGRCLVVQENNEIEVTWERPEDHDTAFLVGGHPWDDLQVGRIERDLTNAIDRIERDATMAAEAAWIEVWVDAAVKAESATV